MAWMHAEASVTNGIATHSSTTNIDARTDPVLSLTTILEEDRNERGSKLRQN